MGIGKGTIVDGRYLVYLPYSKAGFQIPISGPLSKNKTPHVLGGLRQQYLTGPYVSLSSIVQINTLGYIY